MERIVNHEAYKLAFNKLSDYMEEMKLNKIDQLLILTEYIGFINNNVAVATIKKMEENKK